jgi:NADPH:quinone reductase-like Zn-dependent oxidoreductase
MQALHLPAFVADPSTLRPSTIPTPPLAADTLVIRVTHVSPTHVDLLYARGQHQNNRRHAVPPFVLGTDFAGTVERSPTGSPFAPGDRAYGSHFGAFAERLFVPAALAAGVRRVPPGWAAGGACAVGSSGAIALGAFRTAAEVRSGEWVLVTGASGGLGVAAVQVARALGARVVALVGGAEKRGVLERLGVEACVEYAEDGWEARVLEISGGGVSVVYDAVGMVERGIRCCRYGGKVVVIGFAGRGGDMEMLKVNRVLLKGVAVVGYVSVLRWLVALLTRIAVWRAREEEPGGSRQDLGRV